MSQTDQIEYDEQREALIEDAKETKQELDQKQNEALAEIAQGESLENFETVALGNLDMQVRAWVPGHVMPQIQRAAAIAEAEDVSRMMESMETMINALAAVSVDDDYNTRFWKAYFDEYGPTGMLVATEKVLGPAIDSMEERAPVQNMEEKADAAEGFRTDGDGEIVRSGR